MKWKLENIEANANGWVDYASAYQAENKYFGVQHVKRAVPRFIHTSIGAVCVEHEHWDREALVPTKKSNPLKDTRTAAERICGLIVLFCIIFGITLMILKIWVK